MKFTALIVFLLACALPAAAQDVFAPANRVDAASPPPGLDDLRTALAHRPALGGEFSETRKFLFMTRPVQLTGQIDFLPGQGLVLHYLQPEERVVALTPQGLVTRKDPGAEADTHSLPPQMAALNDVFSLELQALARTYTLYFAGDGDAWTLGLDHEPAPLHGGRRTLGDAPHRLVVSGTGADIRHIVLDRPGSLKVEVEVGPMHPLEPDELAQAQALIQP